MGMQQLIVTTCTGICKLFQTGHCLFKCQYYYLSTRRFRLCQPRRYNRVWVAYIVIIGVASPTQHYIHVPMSVVSCEAAGGGREGIRRICLVYVSIVPLATAPSHSSEGWVSPSSSPSPLTLPPRSSWLSEKGSFPCWRAWVRAGLSWEVKGSSCRGNVNK